MSQIVFEKPRLASEIPVSLMNVFIQVLVWVCITEREKSSFFTHFSGECNKSEGNCSVVRIYFKIE